MDWLGLLFEIAFLGMGVYFYLFAIGKIHASDPATQKRMDEFRQRNGGWLRLASLALIAIMLVNVVLHIQQLLK